MQHLNSTHLIINLSYLHSVTSYLATHLFFNDHSHGKAVTRTKIKTHINRTRLCSLLKIYVNGTHIWIYNMPNKMDFCMISNIFMTHTYHDIRDYLHRNPAHPPDHTHPNELNWSCIIYSSSSKLKWLLSKLWCYLIQNVNRQT